MRGWRDAGGMARFARRLLGLDAGLSFLLVVLPMDPNGASQLASRLLGFVATVCFLAAALAFLRWLYLADGNARALGADDLMGSPAMAVIWYFVPLLGLFMPYATMRDLWKASAHPSDWQPASSHPAVPLWWACWLIGNIAGTIALVVGLESDLGAANAAPFLLVSRLASAGSALLLALIVGRIQEMQEDARPTRIFGP
jgi:Domain of unknown function (DUF4328)